MSPPAACLPAGALLAEALMALAKGWPKEGAQRIKALGRGFGHVCIPLCLCRVGHEAVGCFKERECLGTEGGGKFCV